MRYFLHPAAFDDLQDAVDYYDEKSQGLGHQFVTQVETDLLRIVDTPDLLFCPGLNTSELVRLSDKAQRTVERWLKQLKAEQKIEFRGASKTGGYYAMKQQ
ncbi:MAG: hypothetical protein L3K52_17730 [Candidatus Thiothrix sulfatifontis]|nr:MAG: hypothetical protein L3K52_17730 [Candidatus Thiothrix sulfatifontis]